MSAIAGDTPVPGLTARTWGALFLGAVVLLSAVGGFGWWASNAPISAAAVASGTVGPENSRRSIQHFDGGVVEEILVRDGQVVEEGQVLFRLDDTTARATLDTQSLLIRTLEAEFERLSAERRMFDARSLETEFTFSERLQTAARGDRAAEDTLRLEQARFESTRAALQAAVDLSNQTIRSYEVQIAGLEAQLEAIRDQQAVLEEDLEVLISLNDRGLEVRSRLSELRLNLSQTNQLISEREASIAALRESIHLTELQREEMWAAGLAETVDSIAMVSNELQSALTTYNAYETTLERTVVTAPMDGTLIEMTVNTIGGVIAPGDTIVEIVPADEALTLQARIDPRDIDVVAPGQTAIVALLAYPQRNLPTIHGEVEAVSADSLVDTSTGETYYLATIVVEEEAIAALGEGVALVPGMPVEVMIQVASRTFLDYLMEPLIRFRDRALRET